MKNKSILSRLLGFAKPYIHYLLFSLIFAAISVGLTLWAPVITGDAIDLIVGKGNVDFDKLSDMMLKLGIVIAITALAQWVMNICTNKITYKTIKDIREKAFLKIQNVDLKYIDTNPHGDIISRIVTDTEQIADGLIMGFTQLFTGLITIIGTLFFMLTISVTITLVVVVITPLSLFVSSFVAKRTFNMFKEQSVIRGQMTSLVNEMVSNQKIVKSFSYEDDAEENFSKINEDLRVCGVKALFFSALTNPTTRFVNSVVYAAVGILGAVMTVGGRLSVGQLSCFLTYANQYTKPFNEISGVITELQSALASAKRVFEIIDMQDQKPEIENAAVIENCDGSVEIDDVYFSYIPEKPLIEDLNLSVKPGQRIAIVGPTGCGKTTIINLLMRFYDVNRGVIKVSDIPVTDCTRKSLRGSYGMVLQETWLFSGTVKDNITFGKPDATEEEIVAAAKAAFAHSFIKRLPQGYDTIITEDGSNLSQGQKQLLCIARVMLSLPPMLILDEATSSIDTRTEIRVQKAFEAMMKGRTSFIVAHRLSTIKEADVILVMDKGHIIEQGSHDQLLKKGGFYYNLYNSQFSA